MRAQIVTSWVRSWISRVDTLQVCWLVAGVLGRFSLFCAVPSVVCVVAIVV